MGHHIEHEGGEGVENFEDQLSDADTLKKLVEDFHIEEDHEKEWKDD